MSYKKLGRMQGFLIGVIGETSIIVLFIILAVV